MEGIISYVWLKYDLGQKYYAPHVRHDRGSNSCHPDHDSTFHITETPALTTRPSVTLLKHEISNFSLAYNELLTH